MPQPSPQSIGSWQRIARNVASHYRGSHRLTDDELDELAGAILLAMLEKSPGKLEELVVMRATNEARTWLRARARRYELAQRTPLAALEGAVDELDVSEIANRLDAASTVAYLRAQTAGNDRRALEMMLEGAESIAIARRLRMDVRSVERIRARLRALAA